MDERFSFRWDVGTQPVLTMPDGKEIDDGADGSAECAIVVSLTGMPSVGFSEWRTGRFGR